MPTFWYCSECGDDSRLKPREPFNWYYRCLIIAVVLSSFYIDAMAALTIGDYPWSWNSTLRRVIRCRGDLGDDALSAGLLIVSSIAFTIASTIIYRINIDHRYQDRFLFGGITSGVGIGFILGGGLQTAILKVMPWTIMLALMCSIILHALLPQQQPETADEKTGLLD
jgi:MFS family permease